MIEYDKLFNYLKDHGMKKTDLLEIISPQTLAKLGKNETIKTDILDRICVHLEVQPNDIMEVYTIQEINGQPVKVKCKSIESSSIEYTSEGVGITISQLNDLVTDEGTIDTDRLGKMLKSAEEKLHSHS